MDSFGSKQNYATFFFVFSRNFQHHKNSEKWSFHRIRCHFNLNWHSTKVFKNFIFFNKKKRIKRKDKKKYKKKKAKALFITRISHHHKKTKWYANQRKRNAIYFFFFRKNRFIAWHVCWIFYFILTILIFELWYFNRTMEWKANKNTELMK